MDVRKHVKVFNLEKDNFMTTNIKVFNNISSKGLNLLDSEKYEFCSDVKYKKLEKKLHISQIIIVGMKKNEKKTKKKIGIFW